VGTSEPGGILYDAFVSASFCKALLDLVWHRRRLRGAQGEIEPARTPSLRRILGEGVLPAPVPTRVERRNSSVVYGDKLILKLFRRLESGANPEIELGGLLTARAFPHAPALAGSIDYRGKDNQRSTLAALHEFVPNAKDAREFALDALGRYFDRVITQGAQVRPALLATAESVKLLDQDISPEILEIIGTFLGSARLLGMRTAELHGALASAIEGTALAPEPVTPHYLRGVFQSMRKQATENFGMLRNHLGTLTGGDLLLAQRVLELQPTVLQCFRRFSERRFTAKRIRIHGDCHLGQILWTGKDFVFIDFEGKPSLPITERAIKRSPLRDVARLLRSFHYAAYAGLYAHADRGSILRDNFAQLEPWVRLWNRWVSLEFVRAYFHAIAKSNLLPANETELREMLVAYLLDRIMAELGRELRQQSSGRLNIPLNGILYLLEDSVTPTARPADASASSASDSNGTDLASS
jgi:maltose alpha-D-glucosyltransferase / alpha-amylase